MPAAAVIPAPRVSMVNAAVKRSVVVCVHHVVGAVLEAASGRGHVRWRRTRGAG